jgi:N utilization substance protein A
VRAYVLEVRKTNRGPQIIVSRSHRNMLRRLLEYEVPEIYNGQVEIKNIAREAGHRSKVAVAALQDGVDPVGACVGMRGVRIQSIVRELNDEKIDVIEWNSDQSTFIAKSLSPARVSGVYLDDDPEGGRTATVIVPDDQLSLAIGREGQNARLAAKLTGWRIDIKSVTEACFDAMKKIEDGMPDLQPLVKKEAELVEETQRILVKKEANRPVMPEEYRTLTHFAGLVEDQYLAVRQLEREARAAQIEAIREMIPDLFYHASLDYLPLDPVLQDILTDAEYTTVGALMEQYKLDAAQISALDGFDDDAMAELQTALDTFELPEGFEPPVEEPEAVEEEAEAVEATEEIEDAEAVEEVEAVETGEEGEEAEAVSRPVVGMVAEVPDDEPVPPAFPDVEIEELEEIEEAEEAEEPVVIPEPAAEVEEPEPAPSDFVYARDEVSEDDDEDELDKERKRLKDKRRRRELVYDEDRGGVVAKRRRKSSRKTPEWEEWDVEDIDEW